MDRTWARAYAERWGLPQAAVAELNNVLDVIRQRDPRDASPDELFANQPTSPPLSLTTEEVWISPSEFGDRYEEMGLIGEGGMGEVRRMWDNALNRAVAMKVLRPDLADREDLVLRFVEEAQATAQLEHPGIVPVYEIGRLPDGRPYFTMKEIRGRSLLDVIEELHAASSDGSWGTTSTGWTFQRLVGVYQQVCEAVAYAHSRGVLHRDLKPTNVMVGAFGEVVVMDWGLAKIAGQAHEVKVSGGGRVVTARSRGALYQTRSGSVAGTPNYMPPEQARGDHGLIGPWSDVYSLGALLYEILADRAPYDGDDLDEVVARVLAAPPPPPIPRWQTRRLEEGSIEEGLRAVCAKAMAREITDRYMDASTMAEAVSGWLERAGARDHAIALVRRAEQLEPELLTLRSRVVSLRAEAERRLGTLGRDAPFEEKRTAWAIEDQAAELERELQRTEARYADLLKAALAGAPNLPEALSRLEGVRDAANTVPDPGYGAVTLATDPPGAKVELHLLDVVDRRLVPVPPPDELPRVPTRTPFDGIPLPAGTWQIDLAAEGCAPVRVLARVVAGERWSTGPTPGGRPVRLARVGDDPPEAIRIPAGWFLCGGDRELADALPQSRAWVAAFLMTRHPVTCAEWLWFLDQVPAAEVFAPAGFARESGAWRPPPGWRPDQPVRRVTFAGATAYAEWVAARTGRPWRLPRELEWEKAARGVDGRTYPWGNFIDSSWCCIYDGHADPQPASIEAFPLDASPYGIRGLGGNVRDWVIDERSPKRAAVAPEHQLVKGGHYLGVAQFARCALRYRLPVSTDDTVGFRLACPLD